MQWWRFLANWPRYCKIDACVLRTPPPGHSLRCATRRWPQRLHVDVCASNVCCQLLHHAPCCYWVYGSWLTHTRTLRLSSNRCPVEWRVSVSPSRDTALATSSSGDTAATAALKIPAASLRSCVVGSLMARRRWPVASCIGTLLHKQCNTYCSIALQSVPRCDASCTS